MALVNERGVMLLFFIVISALYVSSVLAVVYKVGGSAGWTSTGEVNYHDWSSVKTFDVGDVLHFEYNPQFHNVIEVNHTHFRTCDLTAPIVTYTSGNDSITINKRGHYYFICGFPGHCQAGQKVDIRVVPEPSRAPVPAVSPLFSSSRPQTSLFCPLEIELQYHESFSTTVSDINLEKHEFSLQKFLKKIDQDRKGLFPQDF